jgi:S1-C subfamily serine protease
MRLQHVRYGRPSRRPYHSVDMPNALRRGPGGLGTALLLASVLALGACTGSHQVRTAASSAAASGGAAHLPPASPLPSAAGSQDDLVAVVKRVTPAVVNVTTAVVQTDPFGGAQEGKGVGTGFVIRSDGVIVTNFHVVEGATNIRVTFPAPHQKSYPARVIGGDSDHDLAVLKIDANDLPVLALGDSKTVELGQRVVAIGYALALEGGPTVTSGIISSLTRTIQVDDPNGPTRTYQDVLQTDAAINPGNSGGPLVDLAGNVIGINSAGAGSAENIGFSIAIDAAKPIIQQAITHPNAPVPYLGVSTTSVDPGMAAQLSLPVDRGALVLVVTGPAQQAGIERGDVIVSLDGQSVSSSDDLGSAIIKKKPGDAVKVGLVEPQGQRRTVTVTLEVRPGPTP